MTDQSKLRCKVGDLAILVSPARPENAGKFVTVLEPRGYCKKGENYEYEGIEYTAHSTGFFWKCEAQSHFVLGAFITKTGLIFDHALLPIRPDELDDSTHENLNNELENAQ